MSFIMDAASVDVMKVLVSDSRNTFSCAGYGGCAFTSLSFLHYIPHLFPLQLYIGRVVLIEVALNSRSTPFPANFASWWRRKATDLPICPQSLPAFLPWSLSVVLSTSSFMLISSLARAFLFSFTASVCSCHSSTHPDQWSYIFLFSNEAKNQIFNGLKEL